MFGFKLVRDEEIENLKKYQKKYDDLCKRMIEHNKDVLVMQNKMNKVLEEEKSLAELLKNENEHLKNVINGYKGKIVQFKREK